VEYREFFVDNIGELEALVAEGGESKVGVGVGVVVGVRVGGRGRGGKGGCQM
jgi:hypothetical protein